MNWIAKLTLIISAAIAVIMGILFFIKTIVSPPQQIQFSNQHLISLQQNVAKMKGDLGIRTADSILSATLYAAQLYQQEGFVDTISSGHIRQQIVSHYVPCFAANYRNYFSNSEWNNRQNNELRQKAKYLIGLNIQSDGKPLLTDSLRQLVDSVNIILGQYDDAEKLCRNSYFINIIESERVIKLAKKYASMNPLCNCSTLVKQLNAVNEKLESSHYKELKNMVDELDLYTYYSKDYYQNTLAPKVYAAIKEYKENAQRIYGICEPTQSLENQAKEKYNKASDYFESDDYEEE